MTVISQGFVQPINTTALWQWDLSTAPASVSGFPIGNGLFAPTKTGLSAQDLRNFVTVPLQVNTNPPTPIPDATLIEWIRYAEDRVEQETSILLCQTWVASPPAITPEECLSVGILPQNAGQGQIRGYDYDLEDNAYDFQYNRAQDEGWMYQTLRYRPIQSITYNVSGSAATIGTSAIKLVSYVYPLLNQFFRMPPNWFIEDKDFGLVRFVPAANVMMLPLFAMQLAFMGFAESVPGAIWMQYTAGLTPFDYKARFSFMKELVLAEAALTALSSIQGTINMGAESFQLLADGLQQRTTYFKDGPYGPLIIGFTKRRDYLMNVAKTKVQGPVVGVI